MGRLPTGDRKYNIQNIWEIHHEIVRLTIMGMKNIDIANHLGVSPVMISYTLNSPVVKRQLEGLRAARDLGAVDIAKQIKELLPKAVRVLEDCMDSELPNVKLAAAKDALDRGGHAAIKTVRTENLHGHFTLDEINDIKKRARELGVLALPQQEEEEAIDADYNTR